MVVYHSFEKNEMATIFFLKNRSLVVPIKGINKNY